VSARLPVRKTYKLFVGGAFPRSESGRTLELEGYNVARASRKDARDAVVAARKAFAAWFRNGVQPRSGALPAGRDSGDAAGVARRGVQRAARGREGHRPGGLVRRLGGQARAGSAAPTRSRGRTFNFTVPEPTGVVAVVTPTSRRSTVSSRGSRQRSSGQRRGRGGVRAAPAGNTSGGGGGHPARRRGSQVLTGLRAESPRCSWRTWT
jgi:hypothetical protein